MGKFNWYVSRNYANINYTKLGKEFAKLEKINTWIAFEDTVTKYQK